MNPSNMISLLPHVKINVVIRDPRGIYAESKKWSFIPNDLDKFIQWQKALLKRWNRQKQNVSSNQILEIEFENLVLDYNKTIDKIFLFNGISHSSHAKKGIYFNPQVSRDNVFKWQTELPSDVSWKIFDSLKDVYKPFRNVQNIKMSR